MRINCMVVWTIGMLPLSLAAQAPAAITMDEEPHHHLALKNDVVKVFEVELQPRDSFLMHSHDTDNISIVIGDATTVNVSPGKADVLTMSKDGEVRYSLSGRVHLVRNIGQTPYRFVAIDLLGPQGGGHNVCAAVRAGQPLNCPDAATILPPGSRDEDLLYESDQILVKSVRIAGRQKMKMGNLAEPQLIVTLDSFSASPASGSGPDEALHPGDFVWFDKDGPARTFKNASNKDARFIELTFKDSAPAASTH